MIKRASNILRLLWEDPDLRAYARRPADWRLLRRPRAAGAPPYLSDSASARAPNFRPPAALLSWGGGSAPDGPLDLRLAGSELKGVYLWSLPWGAVFRDPEDAFALHRFAWLSPLLVELSLRGCSAAQAWRLASAAIADWMREHVVPASGPAWHPYTVSERIVNWILAGLACGVDWAGEEALLASIRRQALHLRENLEYYGENWTGNHFSNNGRALYAAGLLARDAALHDAGSRILLNERGRVFDPSGRFPVEGSSHYHFLMVRNYCEALWLSRQAGDGEMAAALAETVARAVEGCWFYLMRGGDDGWSIPLIGDISPDCPPQWLLGVPWVGAHLCGTPAPAGRLPDHGWHRLFLPDRVMVGTAGPNREAEIGQEWARIHQGDWTVFCHINPDGSPRWPGHTHQDTGGIVVYHGSTPVIVEGGRRHYLDDAEGRWGKDCWSHSLLVVDGLNPAPQWRFFYPDTYLRFRSGARPRFEWKDGGLEVSHGGFSRSRGVGVCRRTVYPGSNAALEIEDSVEGRGCHDIDLVFHLLGSVTPSGEGFLIEHDGWKGRLQTPRDLRSHRVWRAPPGLKLFGWGHFRYGESTPITSLRLSGRVRLPWRGLSIIEGGLP